MTMYQGITTKKSLKHSDYIWYGINNKASQSSADDKIFLELWHRVLLGVISLMLKYLQWHEP